jgi:phage/plasmid-like protein (TIGR03299 family)
MTEQTITRIPAWHTLGGWVQSNGGHMDAAQAMAEAGLSGWDVRKEAMFTASGIEIPNRVATVRNTPEGGTEYLGYVGHNYKIQQNEESFEFLDSLVDVSGAHYDAAGYLGRGERVFMSMKMPEGIMIGGEDAHDLYLLATNGHDGFNAFRIAVVPIRLACTNQLTMAMRHADQSFTIRHTVNMAGRIAEARHGLELTFEYVDAFTAEMEALLDQSMTDAAFEELVEGIFPDAKTEGRQEAVESRRQEVHNLFATSDTNAFGRGTKYAAFNALTEYADWVKPVRGDATVRAERIMTGTAVQDFKQYALAAVRAA